jgi:hypothetical protein
MRLCKRLSVESDPPVVVEMGARLNPGEDEKGIAWKKHELKRR